MYVTSCWRLREQEARTYRLGLKVTYGCPNPPGRGAAEGHNWDN
jgi:hypothetical protein